MKRSPFTASSEDIVRAAVALVGSKIRPAPGTEQWTLAHGRPAAGRVIRTHIPDLDHPYIVCKFPNNITYLYPFEVEVLSEADMSDRYPSIHTLRQDTLDWNELNLDFQSAALPVWEEQGREAVNVYCLGA